jgi:hypothetical protein
MNVSRARVLLTLLDGGSVRHSSGQRSAVRRDRIERYLGPSRPLLLSRLTALRLLSRKELRPGAFAWDLTNKGIATARTFNRCKRETPRD